MNKFMRFATPAFTIFFSVVGGALVHMHIVNFKGGLSILVFVLWAIVFGLWFYNLAYSRYWAIYHQGRLDEAKEILDRLQNKTK